MEKKITLSVMVTERGVRGLLAAAMPHSPTPPVCHTYVCVRHISVSHSYE